MTDDWLEAMDQCLYTGAIFLDLRKAFDVVNHDLLVAKLQMHACCSSALLWFKIYLSDRRQCVNIAGTLSDTEVLRSGVSKGSIMGPVLFLLFINDLPLTWTNRNGCALSLCLDGRHLEQTQEERLLGLDIDPSLYWSSHVANLRKKLL